MMPGGISLDHGVVKGWLIIWQYGMPDSASWQIKWEPQAVGLEWKD